MRGRSEFRRVYRLGVRRRRGGVTVILAAGPPGPAHVGFVAGRHLGSAVARNRAKRRLREAAARVSWPPGTAGIVVASVEVLEAPFATLTGWLAEALEEGDAGSRRIGQNAADATRGRE